jgi:hypothetical protein
MNPKDQVALPGVIADIPRDQPALLAAVCRTPADLCGHRIRFGNPTYAIKIYDDDVDRWFFAHDLQDAVAIGLRWHERGCAVEQYPELQDGEVVFGYRVRNYSNRDLEDLFYDGSLWRAIGADINARATPEIMTRLRHALFELLSGGGVAAFCLLDFSRPDGETEFLQNWTDDLEALL